MALEFAPSVSNARLDSIEVDVGVSPILRVFTGAPPATLATADSGTLLAEMTLPADWMAAAASGAKAKAGTWNDPSANAAGSPGYFRIYTSAAVAKAQGTCGLGSGDLSFDAAISLGGSVSVNVFTLTDGNLDQ